MKCKIYVHGFKPLRQCEEFYIGMNLDTCYNDTGVELDVDVDKCEKCSVPISVIFRDDSVDIHHTVAYWVSAHTVAVPVEQFQVMTY